MPIIIFGPSVQLHEERKAIVRKVRRDEDVALSEVRAICMDLMPELFVCLLVLFVSFVRLFVCLLQP